MKKIILALSAVAALAIAVPSSGQAQTVVIKEGGMHRHHDGYRGARAMMRHDRGYHRGWRNHRNVVVIKRGHRHHHH